MENKTHWRKNIDARYISGEDLKNGLKGLKSEMVVTVDDMKDSTTFDQSTQKEITKTALWLKDSTGAKIYKPVILNVTNAKFFAKEFQSDFIEDWYNRPVVIYAQPDKRFGFVARFKKYYPPAQVTDTNAKAVLTSAGSLTELGQKWATLTPAEKNLPSVLALKETLKNELA